MKSILSVLGYEHKERGILGPASAFLELITNSITNGTALIDIDENLTMKRKQMITTDSDTTLGSSNNLDGNLEGVNEEKNPPQQSTIEPEKISEANLDTSFDNTSDSDIANVSDDANENDFDDQGQIFDEHPNVTNYSDLSIEKDESEDTSEVSSILAHEKHDTHGEFAADEIDTEKDVVELTSMEETSLTKYENDANYYEIDDTAEHDATSHEIDETAASPIDNDESDYLESPEPQIELNEIDDEAHLISEFGHSENKSDRLAMEYNEDTNDVESDQEDYEYHHDVEQSETLLVESEDIENVMETTKEHEKDVCTIEECPKPSIEMNMNYVGAMSDIENEPEISSENSMEPSGRVISLGLTVETQMDDISTFNTHKEHPLDILDANCEIMTSKQSSDCSPKILQAKQEDVLPATVQIATGKLIIIGKVNQKNCELYRGKINVSITDASTFKIDLKNFYGSFNKCEYIATINSNRTIIERRHTVKEYTFVIQALEKQLTTNTSFNRKLQKKIEQLKYSNSRFKIERDHFKKHYFNVRLRLFQSLDEVQDLRNEKENLQDCLNIINNNLVESKKKNEKFEEMENAVKQLAAAQKDKDYMTSVVEDLKSELSDQTNTVLKLQGNLVEKEKYFSLQQIANKEELESVKCSLESKIDALNLLTANLKASLDESSCNVIDRDLKLHKSAEKVSSLKNKCEKQRQNITKIEEKNRILNESLQKAVEYLRFLQDSPKEVLTKVLREAEKIEQKYVNITEGLMTKINNLELEIGNCVTDQKKEQQVFVQRINRMEKMTKDYEIAKKLLEKDVFDRNSLITKLNMGILRKQKLIVAVESQLCNLNEKYKSKVSNLVKKVEHMEKEHQIAISDYESQVGILNNDISSLNEMISSLNEKLSQCNCKISTLEEEYSNVKEELLSAKGNLTVVSEGSADQNNTLGEQHRYLQKKVAEVEGSLHEIINFFCHMFELLDEEVLNLNSGTIDSKQEDVLGNIKILFMKVFSFLLKCKKERDILKGNSQLLYSNSPNEKYSEIIDLCNNQMKQLRLIKNIHYGNIPKQDFLLEWTVAVKNLESLLISAKGACSVSPSQILSKRKSNEEVQLTIFLKSLEGYLGIVPDATIKVRIQNVFFRLWKQAQENKEYKEEVNILKGALHTRDNYVKEVLRSNTV
ncbi:hypothetical protein HDV04_002583 [Boothiomyces sp. JEL0838]|nr:hypothetical protein HDV04_002583 [Boothiomyces sp. JEL0838]